MNSLIKQKNGITLIALVITIIVLLILAGVTIAMLSGQNGILSRAQETKFQNDYFGAEERARLAYMTVKTEIMAKRAKNGTYDAREASNAEELRQLVAADLTGTGWGTPTYDSTEKAIKVTYSNASIKKNGISEGKPANNGQVAFAIILGEKDATLSIDGVPVLGEIADSDSGSGNGTNSGENGSESSTGGGSQESECSYFANYGVHNWNKGTCKVCNVTHTDHVWKPVR